MIVRTGCEIDPEDGGGVSSCMAAFMCVPNQRTPNLLASVKTADDWVRRWWRQDVDAPRDVHELRRPAREPVGRPHLQDHLDDHEGHLHR